MHKLTPQDLKDIAEMSVLFQLVFDNDGQDGNAFIDLHVTDAPKGDTYVERFLQFEPTHIHQLEMGLALLAAERGVDITDV